MRLYVMRHGPAEDRAPSGSDFDRRLTPAGRELVGRVARAFQAARGADPLRILASPRVRARETAAIVRSAIGPRADANAIEIAIEIHEELGGESAIPLALIAAAAATGVDTILVGHQPVVEELVHQLVGARAMRTGFSTATIVGLDFDHAADGSGWTLATHLDPGRLPG
jgi:phosphohistidine phosphatase